MAIDSIWRRIFPQRFLLTHIGAEGRQALLTCGLLLTAIPTLADQGGGVEIFSDDFETGDLSVWSAFQPADVEVPSLEIVEPGSLIFNEATPTIVVSYSDMASGLDLSSLTIDLDGDSILPNCEMGLDLTTCVSPSLSHGPHFLDVTLADRSGNQAQAEMSIEVVLDTEPPIIQWLAPADGTLLSSTVVQVEVLVTDSIDRVALVVIDDNGQVPQGDQVSASVSLRSGENLLEVRAKDRAGNESMATAEVFVDLIPPTIALEQPEPGTLTQHPTIQFAGTVEDDNGVEGLWIDGVETALVDSRFETSVSLDEGENLIPVMARDLAGREIEWQVDVQRVTLPEVIILSPTDRQRVDSSTLTVSGSLGGPVVAVWVNGMPATLDGNTFSVEDVAIHDGGTPLIASAFTAAGATITDRITVIRDQESPILGIFEPTDGATVFGDTVAVVGAVRELLTPEAMTVTINGVPATVDGSSFSFEGLPLTSGYNVLEVEAIDGAGNRTIRELEVLQRDLFGDRLELVSGNSQRGIIDAELDEPLVIRLKDDTGVGLAGRNVVFEVSAGSGSLGESLRRRAVLTDASGMAAVTWVLGSTAGAGVHRVSVTAPGARGRVLAIADADPGPPANLYLDSGGEQKGVAGRRLPDPMVVVVTDSGFNRLADVPIRFTVTEGAGSLAVTGELLSGAELMLASDALGRAAVELHLEDMESIRGNVVRADLPDAPEVRFVTFSATGLYAGLPNATSIQGLVLDNSNEPLPGVTLTIDGTALSTTTNSEGYFRLHGVPPEPLHLEVDGTTTTRDGQWPHLEFETTPIPGRDNDLGMPIFMVQLDSERYLEIDESTGGVLELEELPGFALEVAPGSVTFPDGTRSGRIAVTAVHHDKVPMVPNFGQQPRFVITIQPAGAIFDPPARMSLPNVDALPAGAVTGMFSFDHDLGRFVTIGPGVVSEDRTQVVTAEGFGVIKAGWHCGGDPSTAGTTHDCSTCNACDGSSCVAACQAAAPEQLLGCQCPEGAEDRCRFNYRCDDGTCISDEVKVLGIQEQCAAAIGESVTLSVMSNHPPKTRWFAPGGSPPAGTSTPVQTSWSTPGEKSVTAFCTDTKTTMVEVFESCDNYPTDYDAEEIYQAPDGGALGQVHRISLRGEYGGCYSNGEWCPALDKVTERIGIGTDMSSVTPVTGAFDPVVTAMTCEQIIDDLTPVQWPDPYPQGAPAPPANQFEVPALLDRHERFHVSDYRERVLFKLSEEFTKYVRLIGACSPCKRRFDKSTLDRFLKDVAQGLESDYYMDHEKRAFLDGNPEYLKIVNRIRERARLENSDWAACR